MFIVDGHEDIAYNALTVGRDFTLSAAATRAREGTPLPEVGSCALALPDLLAGGIGLVFGTLFTLPATTANTSLPADTGYHSPDEAHRQAYDQLRFYYRLAERPDVRLIRTRHDLQSHVGQWEARRSSAPALGIVLLMENGDPIRAPDEASWWFEQGVRIVGPAWQATRYCGGTRQPGPLTAAGRALMGELARAGLLLDVSHMAEESFWQALDLFDGPVIASHSNTRAHTPEMMADRHLSDAMIRALVERGAVIGTVLYTNFLQPIYRRDRPKAETGLDALLRHIDHICQVAGDARHVAIGSDIDGGFGSEKLPREIDTVADFPRIADALLTAGYSQADTEAIMGGNWVRLLSSALPE